MASRYLETDVTIRKLEAMQVKADKLAEQYGRYNAEVSEAVLGVSASIELVLELLRPEIERRNAVKQIFNLD